MKNKKVTINSKKKNNFFQYKVTIAFNFAETKWSLERVSNVKPFISSKWKGINYSSKIESRKIFDKDNSAIALNVAYN